MRKLFADTFAMITFSWVIGMAIELVIAGLTFGQSVQSRCSGAIANLFTGGAYGRFRDWLFRVTFTGEAAGMLRKTCVSVLSFVVFQVPLYITVLWATGATPGQITAAVGSVTFASAFIGGPYDRFLLLVRRVFRVA